MAIAIGLFGIAASFSAQVLARRKEFGLLVHLGLTRRQILAVVAVEGALWTAVGAALGLALGIAVSVVLVKVVNPQSFHWTMELLLPWPRLGALCAAVVVAGTIDRVPRGTPRGRAAERACGEGRLVSARQCRRCRQPRAVDEGLGRNRVVERQVARRLEEVLSEGRQQPRSRLRFYATQFPLVEVDTSYYAIPLAQTAQNWADRTPAHFTMNMKAFRLFTGHATSAKVLPPDLRAELPPLVKANFYFKDVPKALREALWQRFKEALEPLRSAGKLGMVHFQFAPSILRNRAGHAHVAHCVEMMSEYTVSVEFRHRTWFDDAHLGRRSRSSASSTSSTP